MEEVLPGRVVTYETRREAYDSVDKEKRYRQIEYVLSRFPEGLTAKEIAVQMKTLGYTPTDERNFASPRLTEMMYMGRVKPLDKKRKCKYTKKYIEQLQQENQQLKVYLKPEYIVNKMKNLEQENQGLEDQLKQRDEVIDEAIKFINETWWYEDDYEEDITYFKENYGVDKLLEILQKYKGDKK